MASEALKVGIDWREFEKGTHTGIQSYLSSFLPGAMERRREWTFHLFGTEKTVFPEGPGIAEAIRMGDRFRPYWDQLHIPRACRKLSLDVFVTPYVKMPLLAPCPVVSWLNDLTPLRVPGVAGWVERAYYAAMCRATASRAAAIITISEFTRSDFESRFGSVGGKIRAIHLGVRSSLRGPRHASAAPHGGRGRPYILHVSNLRSHKDVWTLLRAYAQLGAAHVLSHDLVIVGRRENLHPEPSDWLGERGLAERVSFAGEVSDEKLGELYAGADLFVFPSRYEGFGLPVLEAMSAGVPVIASDAASLPEVVGEAGRLFRAGEEADLARALEELLGNESLRSDLGRKGAERAATFSVDGMVDKVLATIESVVAEKKRMVK